MARYLPPHQFPTKTQAGFFPGSGRPVEPVPTVHREEVGQTTGEGTDGKGRISLAALRKACGISQQEMARRLSIQQAAVSKLERRDDMHLSTLERYLWALGGRLDITAHFPADGNAGATEVNRAEEAGLRISFGREEPGSNWRH